MSLVERNERKKYTINCWDRRYVREYVSLVRYKLIYISYSTIRTYIGAYCSPHGRSRAALAVLVWTKKKKNQRTDDDNAVVVVFVFFVNDVDIQCKKRSEAAEQPSSYWQYARDSRNDEGFKLRKFMDKIFGIFSGKYRRFCFLLSLDW